METAHSFKLLWIHNLRHSPGQQTSLLLYFLYVLRRNKLRLTLWSEGCFTQNHLPSSITQGHC